MVEQPKPPPQYHFAWSAITPTVLGLKARFWTRDAKDPLTFKDIVGWVTILGREQRPEAAPENGFHAVVLDDTWYPQLARFLPAYCGVFPNWPGTSKLRQKSSAQVGLG